MHRDSAELTGLYKPMLAAILSVKKYLSFYHAKLFIGKTRLF